MTDNDDKRIRKFFQDRSRDIPDNGFTDKVMRRLPKSNRWWTEKIWTMLCMTAIVVFFVANNCWTSISNALLSVSSQLTTSLAYNLHDIRVTGSILFILFTLTYLQAKDVIYDNEF